MANEQIEISIGNAQELIDFFCGNSIVNYCDYNVILTSDIDMIDYGVITTQSIKVKNTSTQSNVVINLNNHTIKNLYPIFISFVVNSIYCLVIKNGFIINNLINTGSMIEVMQYIESWNIDTTTFKNVFTKANVKSNNYKYAFNVAFENVGFSILGCNFNDCSVYPATILMATCVRAGFLPAFLFKSCSFYIRAYNYEPATNNSLYMNCSFYYDIRCKKITYYKQDAAYHYHRNNIYCFCTFNGSFKKSPDYTDTTGYETIVGYMYNSFYNIETDFEKPLYIACNVDKVINAYYRAFHQDSYGTSTDGIEFDTTTVYNKEKYLSDIVEGKNCCPVLGATGLTDAEMHNTEKLLEIGLLAVDAGDETV